MNNLKRVFSLVLALVMVVGLVMVGAGAVEFSDQEEITHTEAVEVLNALNVILGNPDGSYRPGDTVTRGEMCTIIARILNGGNLPAVGSSTAYHFEDISDHWARNYIEYVANLKIIEGRGDGTFGPDDPVTGAAAAKMLLVAAGYPADVFGFTGREWELTTNSYANRLGLYDEINTADTSDGLSRDNTAQMAYNALKLVVMETGYSRNNQTGTTETYALNDNGDTVLDKYFPQVDTYEGVFSGNTATGETSNKGEIKVGTKTAKYDLDIGLIGETVTVYYKDTGTTANDLDAKDEVLGVYVTDSSKVVYTTAGGIKAVSGTGNEAKVSIDGTTYTAKAHAANADVVIKNFDSSSTVKDAAGSAAGTATAFTSLASTNSPDVVKFILDDDGLLDMAYVTEYNVARVTGKTSTKVTLGGVATLTIADEDIYDGIAKDDVVVYTKFYTGSNVLYTVTKAETVSGKVSAFKNQTNITVDSTDYKIAWTGSSKALSSVTANPQTSLVDGLIGKDVTLYFVGDYVAAIDAEASAATEYSYGIIVDQDVSGTGRISSSINPARISVLDTNGDTNTYTVSDKSTAVNNSDIASKLVLGALVKYTVSGSAAKIVDVVNVSSATALTASDAGSSPITKVYTKSTKIVNFWDLKLSSPALATAVAATGAKLFVIKAANESALATSDSYKVYDLRDLNDIANTATAGRKVTALLNDDGQVEIAVAMLADLPTSSNSTDTTVVGVVKAYVQRTNVGDTPYYQYTMSTADGDVTVYSEDQLTEGALVSYKVTTDNTYASSAFTPITLNTAIAVKAYDEANLLLTYYKSTQAADDGTFHGFKSGTPDPDEEGVANSVTVASDAKIYFVDRDSKTLVEDAAITAFNNGTGYANALIASADETAGVLNTIVVETSGAVNLDSGSAFPTTAVVNKLDASALVKATSAPTDTQFTASTVTAKVYKGTTEVLDGGAMTAGTYTIVATLPADKTVTGTAVKLTFSVDNGEESSTVAAASNVTENTGATAATGTTFTLKVGAKTAATGDTTVTFTFTVDQAYGASDVTVTPLIELSDG